MIYALNQRKQTDLKLLQHARQINVDNLNIARNGTKRPVRNKGKDIRTLKWMSFKQTARIITREVQLEVTWWLMNWKEFRRKRSWPNTTSHPDVCLQRKRRISVAVLEAPSTLKPGASRIQVCNIASTLAWSLGLSHSLASQYAARVTFTSLAVCSAYHIH
jgi:hypothetical protein